MNRKDRREIKTLETMISEYCRSQLHNPGRNLCCECEELLTYAIGKITRCALGGKKTTCAKCPIHGFNAEQRKKVREVMKYSGPHMIYRHPILAICHLIDAKPWRNPVQ